MQALSVQQARRLALISQGLNATKPFGAGQGAVLRCLERLSYVQIDTISVIQRSHHHCLWTRVPAYKAQHLDALQKQRQVFEYWSHAAAYLPMKHYRYCLPYMQAIANGQKHWRSPEPKAMAAVLQRVRAEGPLKAKDFECPDRSSETWGWNWKPAKIALEQLFIEGQLVVSHRDGFQKVYDLPERVLPADLDTSMPTDTEFYRYLIHSTVQAHGLAQEPEFSYLRKGIKAGVRQCLQEMVEDGALIPLRVGGMGGVWYADPVLLQTLSRKQVGKNVHLLSPFDNAVIKRKRIQQLFASDYQLECFVPAAKRQFGYFCLPILYGVDLIGRLDPKADRRRQVLILRSLHLEQSIKDMAAFMPKLAAKLWQLAGFNDCLYIEFEPEVGDRAGHWLARELLRLGCAAPS